MSFNIRNGNANDGANHWNLRKEFLYDVIREHAPDVLGLQEAVRFQLDALNQHFPEYGEVGIISDSTRHTGQYVSILYLKDRFEVHDSGTFWLSDTPTQPSKSWGNHHLRNCTWARLVDKATQQPFYVYNTHLDDGSQPSREKAAQLIMQRFHRQTHRAPLILMGDLNVAEDNPVIAYLTGNGKLNGEATPLIMVDTFRFIHPYETTVGTFNGFKGYASGPKIDYIFASAEFHTLDAAIVRTSRDGRTPSDHFPLTAHLRFKATN
jgi:endonuclease/exonuclease/phosphatase family metal-dependent hydrolase